MIAVDTNLLVYAHRADSEWHERALGKLLELISEGRRWAIPWPCVHEFISITTHPKIYEPPSPVTTAFAAIREWAKSPYLTFIGEGISHFDSLEKLALAGAVKGPMIHDARIYALCLNHGVKTLWSCDRDFSRFKGLKIINPLLD